MHAEEVLAFSFGPTGAASRWWEKDPAFDQLLRDRFAALHRAIASGTHEDWRTSPRSCLAYVVVIDQFARNSASADSSTATRCSDAPAHSSF